MSGIVGQNLGRGSGLIKAGAIDDDSVTLAKMAGLARGKLIYGDSSGDPAALAVGGADEVLTHDGTDFDWAAAAGGGSMVHLLKYTITSSAAELEFDSNYITSAYNTYELVWNEIFNDNAGNTGSRMQFQFGDDNGYHTDADYYSVQYYIADTASSGGAEYVTEDAGRLAEAIGSETYRGTSGHMRFYSVWEANVTRYLGIEHHRRAPGGYYMSFPSGRLESATAWNKMKLMWNGDETYEGGTFSLYGIKES